MAYVVQAGLGGHAIPIDAGTMAVLHVLDLVTDKDVEAGVVPGLERAVAKSKGIEFGSLLHELGADYSTNPYSRGHPRDSLADQPGVRRPAAQAAGRSRLRGSGPSPRRKSRKSRPKRSRTCAAADGVEPSQKKPSPVEEPPPKPAAEKSLPQAAAKKHSASERLSKRKPR